jgi:hypothetical protein
MLFTCYCTFIIIVTVRGSRKKLFTPDDIRISLLASLAIVLSLKSLC